MDTDLTSPTSPEAEAAPLPPAPPQKRSLRWLYWLPVAFALGLVAGYLIFALPLTKQLASANQELTALRSGSGQEQAAVPQNVKRYDIPVEGFPSFGPKDAPITIVEFSDYECPFCKQWHEQVWNQLEKKYGSQIRLVYRDFPLFGLHDNAEPAAEAAHCADEQGKYWSYHDLLFSGDYQLSRQSYEAIAVRLGLDSTKFAACLDTGTYKNVVQSNYDFASKLGVQSTPTFFVNGMALVGAQPFEVFDRLIQMEIKGQLPKK
jgi:protein-disulfide isomerase